jgi:hypothetical protein
MLRSGYAPILGEPVLLVLVDAIGRDGPSISMISDCRKDMTVGSFN